MGNMTIFSMYLLSLNYLKPESIVTKIILLLNFIIVELVMIYKRLIKKDINYILSVQSGKHGKYAKKDIFMALFISTLIIILAIGLDDNPMNFYKKTDVLLSSIFLIVISMIGIVLYVTAIANYKYSIKNQTINK